MDYDFFYRGLQAVASIRYFDRPVAMMGGGGVSSDPRFLLKRLEEEQTIQASNEKSPFWRMAQKAFYSLYRPYKIRRLSRGSKEAKA